MATVSVPKPAAPAGPAAPIPTKTAAAGASMAPAAAASTTSPAAAPAPAPAPSKPAKVAPASTGGATGPSLIAVLLLLIGGGAMVAGLLGFGAQMFSTITSGILLGVGFLVTLVAGFKKLFGG